MPTTAWINWLHLMAAVVWIGGLVFMIGVLFPLTRNSNGFSRSTFITAAMAFRPYTWVSMVILLFSGMGRVQALGGMRELPPLIHAKIGIGVLMILLGLISSLYFLPKLAAGTPASPLDGEMPSSLQVYLKGYLIFSGCIIFLGAAVLLLLAASGLI